MTEYPYGEGAVNLVDAEWAEEHLDDAVLVDVQPNFLDYLAGHLPGAVYLAEDQVRTMRSNIPAQYVPPSVMEALLGELGIGNDDPVVVYTGRGDVKGWGDGQHQATVAYALARFGHRDVHLLDGGLRTWKEEGRPVSQEYPDRDPATFDASEPDWAITYDEFLDRREREDAVVLDARPAHAYEGQVMWPEPGHIPGAVNVPWRGLYRDDNPTRLRPLDEVEDLLESKGVTRDREVICSCGLGRFASNLFIALHWLLDYPEVTFYEAGFTEWIARGNETETGPGPR